MPLRCSSVSQRHATPTRGIFVVPYGRHAYPSSTWHLAYGMCVREREREREYVLNHNRTMLSCIFCPHVTKIVCRNVLTTRQLSAILALKKDCFTRQTSSSGKRTILYHRCLFIRGLSASCK